MLKSIVTQYHICLGIVVPHSCPTQFHFQLKNELIKETRVIWNEKYYAYSNHVKFVEPKYLGLSKNIFEQKICAEYIEKYVKYFFKKSDGQPMNVDYDVRKIRMFNPFLTSNSAFHLIFSFNDDIDLKRLKTH